MDSGVVTAAKPRCCIIGAGCSGIVTAKALKDRGIPFDWYEASASIGGVWAFDNPSGTSAAYRALHIDTSKSRLELADFPVPADYPEYPHHSQILAYLNAYIDRFGLRDRVRLRTPVERAQRRADGLWEIRLGDGRIELYDALLVCNGHHWDPRWPKPDYPGVFFGKQIHVRDYRDPFQPIDMRGKAVLVVGMGNSAMDIASELAPRHIAARLFVSARRGVYIFPRFMMGGAADKGKQYTWLPLGLQRFVNRLIYRIVIGRMEDYGLPKPDHKLFESHGTVSDTFPSMVAAGDIHMRPGIERYDGDFVQFTDGKRERIDAIVWATGYNVTFPFFDPDFISAPDNRLPLFKRVFKPGIPNLAFIGLMQSSITVFVPVEQQAKWIAAYLAGDYALPDVTEMERAIVGDEARHNGRYYKSARHTMQVDQDIYIAELHREWKRGARRARQADRLPVPASAVAAQALTSAAAALPPARTAAQ